MPAPIVLLTDFGFSEYVGVMKGVIARHAPHAPVIDLCHDVGAHGVREGAWLLAQCYRWFPEGSVFLAVVDPGVGTARRALAVETEAGYFVGPDNGLLYPAALEAGIRRAVCLKPLPGASSTFHGRDVFSPAAARLACGVPLELLGESLERPKERLIPLSFHRDGREGEIVRIDRFGNCITNLPPIPGKVEYDVAIEVGEIPPRLRFYTTYEEAPHGAPFLVESSYGTLEIAVREASAAERIKTRVASRVVLA